MCCGGVMPFYEYEHIPGIDWLGRDTASELSPRQLGSAARQLGKKQTLTETFACCGWNITPAQLKRIAGFQYACGANLLCQHLLPYSEHGQRKKDYPAHFNPINPWIEEHFKDFNNYFARLGYLLSESEESVNVAMLHPMRSAYFGYQRGNDANAIPESELDPMLHEACRALSCRGIGYGIPGCPQTKQSKAIDFFDNLKKELEGKKAPIWSGELYLEYHRGTYTSMARNKKWNRRAEFALTNVETEAIITGKLCDAVYPDLQEPWEILMRNQFHDILPGSSIREVYEDSKAEYERLFAITGEQEQKCLQMLSDGVGDTIVWNPNGQAMSGFVVLDQDDARVQTQKTADGKFLAWAENVPSKGYAVLKNTAPICGQVTISTSRVETPYAEITFDEHGHIISWYDKDACRQILQENQRGNVLMTYEDKPFQFDNWNLQDYYKEKSWPVDDLRSAQVIENGPYRYGLKFNWQYLDTPISEIVYFYSNSPRVDFHFQADWKEDQLVLKALFPLEVNTTEATFEIQYGNVKRPTVYNTSWDTARFEVCHQKWMDVAEGGYGVSILNDCKYGVSVEENVVGLTLLKSGRYPNPVADRELHEAVYSVFPHRGSWQEAGTVAEAYQLNNPLTAVVPERKLHVLPSRYSVVSHEHRNIMIEAVKKAEDSDGVIIRLYEFENAKTNATLRLGAKAKKIWRCNLMEEKEVLLAENTDLVVCPVEPFGIETILVEE